MRVWRYLLAPWWLIELGTGAKAFCDNPLLGSRRLNARGLHAGRVRLAERMADRRRRKLTNMIKADDRAAFERDGFLLKRDFLPPEEFAALREQVLGHAAPAREQIQGDTITRRIAVDPAYLKALPAVRKLLGNKRWRGLIRYAGSYDAEPLYYVQTILPHRIEAAPDPQTSLHVDTFHPTVKAWFFLTDVEEEDGPFVYVPGSHRADEKRLAWEKARSLDIDNLDRLSARGSLRIEASELASLGLPAPKSFAVPANTLVVADTHGFHARGQATRASTRVEIWAYHRRNPFLPWSGLDLFGVPGLAERRVPLFWKVTDALQRWTPQHWRDVGRKRPGD